MNTATLSPLLLRAERPPRALGVLAAVLSVAIATALIYPLKQVTPVLSLGVLYVLAVLVVSTYWGLGLGIATSLLSAAAFNFFHLRPAATFVSPTNASARRRSGVRSDTVATAGVHRALGGVATELAATERDRALGV